MKKIFGLCILFSLVLVTGAFAAGSWFDDFEGYADQAAMDNPADPLQKWTGADGKLNGILDLVGQKIKNKSMRCEQYPTETRPTRKIGSLIDNTEPTPDEWTAWQGCLSLWVYDDGADIKSFDVQIKNTTHYVGLGLRDNQLGVDTEYTCNKDGVVANTGITRSTGWHVFQINVNNAASGTESATGLPYVLGAEMLLDAQRWSGNVLTSMTDATDVTIYTNFGSSTDENKIWVDSVEWSALGKLGVPHMARMGDIDDFQPPNGLSDWDVLSGSNTGLTNAPDGGDPANLHLDAFDPDAGLKGFYYKGSMVVPKTATYILECPFMNGPSWETWNPWPEMTFSIGGVIDFNVGSASTGPDWGYIDGNLNDGTTNWNFRPRFSLIEGDPITIEVTGDSYSPTINCFCRIYRFELLYISNYTPPPPPTRAQKNWILYE